MEVVKKGTVSLTGMMPLLNSIIQENELDPSSEKITEINVENNGTMYFTLENHGKFTIDSIPFYQWMSKEHGNNKSEDIWFQNINFDLVKNEVNYEFLND